MFWFVSASFSLNLFVFALCGHPPGRNRYVDYLKAFRTVEDAYVQAALLGCGGKLLCVGGGGEGGLLCRHGWQRGIADVADAMMLALSI